MFDQFLITVNQMMTGGLAVAGVGAFAWGMISVLFSPCHLASIPLIVAYVGGQQEIFAGSVMMLLFALGHCLPIVFAGSYAAAVRRLTESAAWQDAGVWFRKGAGVVIGLLGIYFIVGPLTGIV